MLAKISRRCGRAKDVKAKDYWKMVVIEEDKEQEKWNRRTKKTKTTRRKGNGATSRKMIVSPA